MAKRRVANGFDKKVHTRLALCQNETATFELLYDTMQQLEYGEAALLTGLEKVPSHIKKFLVDPTGNYHQSGRAVRPSICGRGNPWFLYGYAV